MRVVFIGPPGSGKGTQAARIVSRYRIPHISTGDLLRAAVASDSALGREADGFMRAGALVPDRLTVALLQERMKEPDARKGFLLDGFPRTVDQAKALSAMLYEEGVSVEHAIVFEVPDEAIVERIVGRRTDPVTGEIYHLRFRPPPEDVVARLVQRKDDTEEACRARLSSFHEQTAPLIPFYEALGVLHRVSGVGSPEEISQKIAHVIDTASRA